MLTKIATGFNFRLWSKTIPAGAAGRVLEQNKSRNPRTNFATFTPNRLSPETVQTERNRRVGGKAFGRDFLPTIDAIAVFALRDAIEGGVDSLTLGSAAYNLKFVQKLSFTKLKNKICILHQLYRERFFHPKSKIQQQIDSRSSSVKFAKQTLKVCNHPTRKNSRITHRGPSAFSTIPGSTVQPLSSKAGKKVSASAISRSTSVINRRWAMGSMAS